jgi:iduronate 2-sulfatase
VTSPYTSGSDDQLRELRRHYYAAVSWADHATGKVLDELDNLGLHDSTLVVMHADHGECLRRLPRCGRDMGGGCRARRPHCSEPRAGGACARAGWHLGEYAMWEKRSNWELATRVPLIMRAPWLPASVGARSRALVELVDIYQTVRSAGLDGCLARAHSVVRAHVACVETDACSSPLGGHVCRCAT